MKPEEVYLRHILYCIGRIREDCAPGKEAVRKSLTIQDAVARNLQILCESTQRLTPESQAQHPEIDWKGVSGFRNVLTHDYLSLDFETIWSIIERDLPPLERAVRDLLEGRQPSSPAT